MNVIDSKFAFGGWIPDAVADDITGPSDVGEGFDQETVDLYWMKQALRESMNAVGISSPNPPVGCVIVKSDKCICRGSTAAYGGAHAETNALAKVGSVEAEGATAYVTLEPCSHQGKQGPCVDRLIDAKIKRCVIGLEDPNPLVAGKGIEKLRESGVEVVVGVLNQACWMWLSPFYQTITTNKIFVALKWAQTLDGHLADDQNSSKWITGPLARRYTHWLRQKYDLIMVGAGTVLADNPTLNVRDCRHIQRHPVKVVFDPQGRVLKASKKKLDELEKTIFNRKMSKVIYATAEHVDESFADEFNLEILPLKNKENAIQEVLEALELGNLHENLDVPPFQSILVEGGPRLLSMFFNLERFDCIHTFIAPTILSGTTNRIGPMTAVNQLTDISRYKNVVTAQLGDDILLEMVAPEVFSQWEAL